MLEMCWPGGLAVAEMPGPSSGPKLWRRRSFWFRLIGLLVAASMGFVAVLVKVVYFPHQDDPVVVDAIVVPAGGAGERLELALQMAEEGVSQVMVLNRGYEWHGPEADAVRDVCDGAVGDLEVVCVDALPDSTIGEAVVFGKVLQDMGAETAFVVTSNFHLHRAATWVDRCFAGRVYQRGAPVDRSWHTYEKEILATGDMYLRHLRCPRG